MIKAIETEYNNDLFRSRLEARWAVFFNTLGVKYEYEKEGYDLDGIWYLPDFWLPKEKCWIEIKPKDQWIYHRQSDLLSSATGNRVLYISGNPWLGEYGIGCYPINELDSDLPAVFALDRKNDNNLWIVAIDRNDNYIWAKNLGKSPSDYWPLVNTPQLQKAYLAARQARFEHGKNGHN